jgi:hypothetical protein
VTAIRASVTAASGNHVIKTAAGQIIHVRASTARPVNPAAAAALAAGSGPRPAGTPVGSIQVSLIISLCSALICNTICLITQMIKKADGTSQYMVVRPVRAAGTSVPSRHLIPQSPTAAQQVRIIIFTNETL